MKGLTVTPLGTSVPLFRRLLLCRLPLLQVGFFFLFRDLK